jgi:predicted amidophosphoribosyltransferase
MVASLPLFENTGAIEHYDKNYTLGFYFPSSILRNDKLSKALRIFKSAGISRYNKTLFTIVAHSIGVKANEDFPTKMTVIIRALGHREQVVKRTDQPLDKLGKMIESTLKKKKAFYVPQILAKLGTHAPLHYQDADSRERTIKDKYIFFFNQFVKSTNDGEGVTVLVIDDVRTTGATLTDIGRSVRKDLPKATLLSFSILETVLELDFDARDYNSKLVNRIRLFGTLIGDYEVI